MEYTCRIRLLVCTVRHRIQDKMASSERKKEGLAAYAVV